MPQVFSNNGYAVLAAPITASALTIQLSPGSGARFKAPTGGDYGLITLFQMSGSNEINHEIVKYTERSGDTLTVPPGGRGFDDTTARAFNAADPVSARLSAAAMTPGALGAYPVTNPANYTANLGTVTAVSASGPLQSTGGATPNVSLPAASSGVDGYLRGTDWATFSGKQATLGYAPVQQGTGIGQLGNAIKIGWSASSKLKLTVDSTDYGASWPIDVAGSAASITGINAIANGGTGSATAAGALVALGAYPATNPSGYVTSGANTFTGAQSLTEVDKGTVSTGTVTFTRSAANVQRLQVGGPLTLAVTGFPAAGIFADLLIKLVNAGAFAVTFPTIQWILPTGATTTVFATYLTAISRPSLQSAGTDFIYLWTDDAGATIYGKLL